MNQKSASALNRDIYLEETISFDKIPGQSRLFLDYQKDSSKLSTFYPSKFKGFSEFSSEVLANHQIDRKTLCNALTIENEKYDAGEKTLENIERLRESDCFTVFTGQQAGLFSGPIYTIYKALSAIKLAETLTNGGMNVIPVFWIASEDHDFDEISKTASINRNNAYIETRYSPENLVENSPIGFVEIDDGIYKTIEHFIDSQTSTEFTEKLRDILKKSYTLRATFGNAFGKLLAELFRESGLVFVSPLNESLRNLSSPIFEQAIKHSETIADRLLRRNTELREAGYHSQVLVEDDFFPFFFIDEQGQRNALRFDNNTEKILAKNSNLEWSKKEFLGVAKEFPECLSPNALMRPVVQDYLFPTVCYFGGGAEIAYFAQNSVIYEVLNRPVTPIRHRSSFTIIDGKHSRNMRKHGLEFSDLFSGKDELLARIVDEYLNPTTTKLFDETFENVDRQLESLKNALGESDPSLLGSLKKRREKILWHIDTLKKKFQKAEISKDRFIKGRVDGIFDSLLPKGVLQERNLNFLYFYNLYGENFIDWIYDAVETDEMGHKIIIF